MWILGVSWVDGLIMVVGWIRGVLLFIVGFLLDLFVGVGVQYFGVCYDFVVDFGYVVVYGYVVDYVFDFYVYFQYVIGNDLFVEMGFVYFDYVEQFGLCIVVQGELGEYVIGLGYCFDDQYVGYDWLVWEVVLEKGFVDVDVFGCDDGVFVVVD